MTDKTVAVRDAATVVVTRQGESGLTVLLGMRGAKAAFMPSKFVFPGGAVDPGDYIGLGGHPVCDELRIDAPPGTAEALMRCAARELREETGLALTSDAELTFFFRAITPPGRPRRFDARFFLVDASAIEGDPDDFDDAQDELSHLQWVPLAEARALDLPFITEVVLAEIEPAATQRQRPVPFFDNRTERPQFRYLSC